ncbi:MAG: NAD-dependent deacetylase [Magnetococcales bacterium]|nr:NAD-dependent deacetylase [Magnetococcales bacterium]
MTQELQSEIQRAAEAVNRADALLITAGAGMGIDSGLPDFRGNEGFWNAYPPIRKLGLSFAEMANPHWFSRDPALAWAFYGHRLALYRSTTPHEGFKTLGEWCLKKRGGGFVFTSNVDGQFQQAGFPDTHIEECHGSLNHLQCTKPCSDAIWSARGVEVVVDEARFKAREPLPRCPSCGALARPNVLMFGDWSWNGERTSAQGRRMHAFLEGVRHNGWRLVILEFGAGKAVPTVRQQSEAVAESLECTLIRINPRDPEVPGPEQISLPMGALAGLEAIRACL